MKNKRLIRVLTLVLTIAALAVRLSTWADGIFLK